MRHRYVDNNLIYIVISLPISWVNKITHQLIEVKAKLIQLRREQGVLIQLHNKKAGRQRISIEAQIVSLDTKMVPLRDQLRAGELFL